MGFLGIDDYLGGADLPLLHNQKVPWVDVVSGIGNSGLLVSKGPEFEKRRDRALKKSSWSKEQMEDTELSGKSLSDSDINYRVSMIVKEAKQILDVGKRIGVNFVGNENEVINDLVDIELKA
ncbi:hypothetical protein V6N13_025932 [Hibiscus sabdariffa]